MRLMTTKIAGTKHHAGEIYRGMIPPGTELILEPEPDNPYDPEAVMVMHEAEEDKLVQLGHLPANPAKVTQLFKNLTEAGARITCRVVDSQDWLVELVTEDLQVYKVNN